MLDDLDWELDRRGHTSCATPTTDVSTSEASARGERVMESITHYIEQRLKLRVNRQKSAVAPAVGRPLLGFQFFRYRDGRIGVTVAPKALKRAEDRIRQLTTRNWGVSMERRIKEINRFTVGWTGYFAFADTVLPFEKLEKWLRRRLRQVRWKEWKRPQTRYRNLRALGIPDHDARSWAASQKGYWRVAGSWPLQRALPERLLAQDRWSERVHRSLPPCPGMLSEPPGADPHAGWCGRGQGEPGLYPMYARHDQRLGGESPLWRLMAPTTSQGQLRRREAGWEGSRRRNRDPRNTWRIATVRGRVSCAYEARRSGRASIAWRSPMSIKGPLRRRGGCAVKAVGLIRGGLRGCPKMPVRCASTARRVVRDGGVCEGVARRGEVSRGRITGGVADRREGPNAKPRCRTLVLVGWMLNAANPKWGLRGRVRR